MREPPPVSSSPRMMIRSPFVHPQQLSPSSSLRSSRPLTAFRSNRRPPTPERQFMMEENNYTRTEQLLQGSVEHPIVLVEQEQRDDIITKALSTSSSSPTSPSRNHRKRQGGIWNKIVFFGSQSNHAHPSPASAASPEHHHFRQSATHNVRFYIFHFDDFLPLFELESLMNHFFPLVDSYFFENIVDGPIRNRAKVKGLPLRNHLLRAPKRNNNTNGGNHCRRNRRSNLWFRPHTKHRHRGGKEVSIRINSIPNLKMTIISEWRRTNLMRIFLPPANRPLFHHPKLRHHPLPTRLGLKRDPKSLLTTLIRTTTARIPPVVEEKKSLKMSILHLLRRTI